MWITNEDFPIAGFLVCTSQNIITILKHSLMNEPQRLETQRDSSKSSTNIKHIQTVLLKFLFFSLEFLRVFHTHIFPDFFFLFLAMCKQDYILSVIEALKSRFCVRVRNYPYVELYARQKVTWFTLVNSNLVQQNMEEKKTTYNRKTLKSPGDTRP